MATVNKAFRVKNGLIVEGAELKPALGTETYPPILFTSGTNLTTPAPGAMEYDGTNFYLTAATGGRKTIAFTDLVPSAATSSALGTMKLGSDTQNTATAASVGSTNGRTYLTQFNASQQLVVNVPWTDTVYTLPTATATALGGIELFSGTTQSVAANAVTTTASRTYGLQLNSDLQGVVNVPWTDTVYTLPAATDTVRGGIELLSATVQSVAANSVTTTASRTYGLQVNADGQGVINVPWTDTDTYPTTFAYTGGTTAGPTGSLTGVGMSAVSFAAIPSAASNASGIVTTGAQEFGGVKTLTSPAITTSLTTGSTSFDLVNTTATTVNFAGAGTAVSIGSATGNTTVNNSLVVTGNLTVNGTTTTVNSTTITVDDIVLELGAVASPSNTTANGGGILVKAGSDVDKTLTWSSTGANWTSSENLSLATGKTYKINNVDVLSATGLGSTVVSSSLTSVGTITSGTWSGSFGAVSGANLTTLNASNISSGTIGAARLPSVNIGTTAVDLTRSSGALTLAGLTLTTPVLGVATATSINKVAITAPATSATLTIADGKTLTASNTLTFTGTDGSTLNIGTGGTLGTGAFATIADYAPKASPALTGTPTIDAYAGLIARTGTTTGTTAATISNLYDRTVYNGGEFTIKATNGSNVEITKVLVITNGTDVYMTTYGDVFISSDLVTVDFSYTVNSVNMLVTPVANTTGTTTVKVTGTLLAV